MLADAFEQLGFGAENGTWRNAYLAGAAELRYGNFGTPATINSDMLDALTVTQVFDGIAIRIDGPRAWDTHMRIVWDITDEGRHYLVELSNGALHHRELDEPIAEVPTIHLERLALIGLITGSIDVSDGIAEGSVVIDGDPTPLIELIGLLAAVDPNFNIVLP